jgi:hypothetical protein
LDLLRLDEITLIQGNATEFGSHLYWHEAQLHFAPERCGCLAEAGDGVRYYEAMELIRRSARIGFCVLFKEATRRSTLPK